MSDLRNVHVPATVFGQQLHDAGDENINLKNPAHSSQILRKSAESHFLVSLEEQLLAAQCRRAVEGQIHFT